MGKEKAHSVDKSAITQIICGLRVEKEKETKIRIILDNNGYKGLQVKRADLLNNNYGIKIV